MLGGATRFRNGDTRGMTTRHYCVGPAERYALCRHGQPARHGLTDKGEVILTLRRKLYLAGGKVTDSDGTRFFVRIPEVAFGPVFNVLVRWAKSKNPNGDVVAEMFFDNKRKEHCYIVPGNVDEEVNF